MAGTLKISLNNLDKLKRPRISKDIAKEIGQGAIGLHSALRSATIEEYSKPRGKTIDSIFKNRSVSIVKTGKSVTANGLEYSYKPEPLANYPTKEIRVKAFSRFILDNKIYYKNYALKPLVRVKRKKGYIPIKSSTKFPAFMNKGRSRKNIYARKRKDTWITEPIIRAPIVLQFGPSLAGQVNTIYRKNHPKVLNARRKFINNINKHIQKL